LQPQPLEAQLAEQPAMLDAPMPPATPREQRDAQEMAPTYADTRVVKRLSALQPGALKMARRYGSSFVCVRYRHDRQGHQRYTTVELVVDQAPIASRNRPDQLVMVYIDFKEPERWQTARAGGATFDRGRHLWRMPLRLARKLKLVGRIVRE
jgi:hypothetical protein